MKVNELQHAEENYTHLSLMQQHWLTVARISPDDCGAR